MQKCDGFFVFLSNLKIKIMDIKELRIGNTILQTKSNIKLISSDLGYYDFAEEKEVTITKRNFNLILDHLNVFRPIPITKEVLLRLGFEDRIDEMVFNNGSICFYWRKFENHFEINGEKYFITELHRMQNLIYEMFRIELKFIN